MNQYIMSNSYKGISHVKRGMPNQDAIVVDSFEANEKNITFLLAADGVSSCPKAEEASSYLVDTSRTELKKFYESSENMTEDKFKNIIQDIYNSFLDYVKQQNGKLFDYGSTLEIVVVQDEEVFTLHAGDGLVALLKSDGDVLISKNDSHAGEIASQVYPFFVKEKWEFNHFNDIAAALVATDGVYDEIVPNPARKACEYDITLLLPLIDPRGHRDKNSWERYINSYITGKLNDKAIFQRCKSFINKKIMTDIRLKDLKDHFKLSVPYKRFGGSSKDDLSIAVWVNMDNMPEHVSVRIPPYFDIWRQESEISRERAKKQVGIYK